MPKAKDTAEEPQIIDQKDPRLEAYEAKLEKFGAENPKKLEAARNFVGKADKETLAKFVLGKWMKEYEEVQLRVKRELPAIANWHKQNPERSQPIVARLKNKDSAVGLLNVTLTSLGAGEYNRILRDYKQEKTVERAANVNIDEIVAKAGVRSH